MRSSSYRNEDLFTSGSGDYEVRADFQVRWRENISDGFEKECVSEESINVYTDEEVEDHYLFRRYVVTQFNNGVDKCADFTGQDYTILVRIPDRYTGNEEYTYTYQASYQNSNYDNAGFITNKVKNSYENREVNFAPLINEIELLPYKYSQIQQVRALLNFEQNDRFCIDINKRSNTNNEDETIYLWREKFNSYNRFNSNR